METKEQLKQRITELETKIKQVAEEFNKQHELLDQYELSCTDEIIRLKNQKIAELEEENKNLKLCRCCECQSENEYMLHNTIRDLEQENAKLQEQLKFVNIAKYKLGEEVYVVDLYLDNISSGKIQTIHKSYNSDYGCNEFEYEVQFTDYDDDDFYDSEMYFEHEIFQTQADAQKYLEEHK